MFGVAHNVDSLPFVWSADACSWNNKRLDFEAFTFQVRAHCFEDHAVLDVNKSSHIFCNNEGGFDFFNDSKHFWPEISVVTSSFLFSCNTVRLAGETTCEDVDGIFDVFPFQFFNIIIYLNSFPMFLQQHSAIFFSFTKGYCFKTYLF